MNRIRIKLLAVSLAAAQWAHPQTQPVAVGKIVTTSAQEVLLDVIARDKKGKAVLNLTKDQFQVADNGEPVTIKSFRLVTAADKAGAGAVDAKQIDTSRQLHLVTLVFERLGQEGRTLARQAALDLIKGEPEQNVFYAVFTIDQQLGALQQFTNDRALLKKAIERATSGAYTQFAEDSARIRHDLEQQVGAPEGQNGQSQVEQVGAMPPAGGHDPSQMLMARMMLNMLQLDQTMSGLQAGRSSIFSLLALVRDQNALPGRKTLMYFTEGLYVPDNLQAAFEAVIGAANRANVSVYALDARGLRIAAENGGASAALRGAAASSKEQQTQGNSGTNVDQVKVFDTVLQSSRDNAQNTLAALSEGTGGFLIYNTNDLRAPLRRVDEDINTYYELTYTPDIKRYDGHFRKIAVKLDRADVKLQSRSGYFALPPNAGPNVLPYEVPLLAALATAPLPRTFPFHEATLRFHPGKDKVKCALVLEAPFKDLTLKQDTNMILIHLAVVTLVKDAGGNVVQKFSQDVPLQVPAEKKEALLASEFIFNKHFDLAPGRYTVETAVADFLGDKASARKAVLMVPAPASGVGLSNVSLVRSYTPHVTATDAGDPFRYNDGKVSPSLDEMVTGGKGAQLSLFFVIYPEAGNAAKPGVEIQLMQDGKPIGGGALELPAVDKDGRIPYVATIPIESLPAGQYQVKVTARQGTTGRAEETLFQVR